MKLLKHLLILITLCQASIIAEAQQRNFSISFSNPFPSSADSGQAETAYVIIRNLDTANYAGSYNFAYTINGGAQQVSTSSSTSGFRYIPKVLTIASGDSIQDTLLLAPNQPQFMSGPSVVVIWPIKDTGDAIATIDSANFNIEIIFPSSTGIGEIIEGALYYNNGRIMLRETGKNELMQVRIWNANGAEMYYTEGEQAQYIELPDLPAGMYIAEAVLSNNKRAILKFIKPLH